MIEAATLKKEIKIPDNEIKRTVIFLCVDSTFI